MISRLVIVGLMSLQFGSVAWGTPEPESATIQDSVARLKTTLRAEHSTQQNIVSSSLAQQQTSVDSLSANGWQMLQGLGLCVGMFLIAVAVVRRLRSKVGGSLGRRLQIIERLPLTSKSSLILAVVDDQQYVLAVGSEHVVFGPGKGGTRGVVALSEEVPCVQDQSITA